MTTQTAAPLSLTTTFSLTDMAVSSACFSSLYYDSSPFPVIFGPGTQCLPAGPAPTSQSLSTYYSPGIGCPASYTVACSSVVQAGTVTETRATCCPRPDGLGQLSSNRFICQTATASTDIASSPQYAQYGCTMLLGDQAASVYLTVTNTTQGGGTSTLSVEPTQGPNAYSVQIRWQNSDFGGTTAPATTGATSNPTVSAITSAASSTTFAASPAVKGGNGEGLSTGVIVGLAVGITILTSLIVAAAVWYVLRWKTKQANNTRNAAAEPLEKYGGTDNSKKPIEVIQIYEVPSADRTPVEMDGKAPRSRPILQELPADSPK